MRCDDTNGGIRLREAIDLIHRSSRVLYMFDDMRHLDMFKLIILKRIRIHIQIMELIHM